MWNAVGAGEILGAENGAVTQQFARQAPRRAKHH